MAYCTDVTRRLDDLLRAVASRKPVKSVVMAVESGDRTLCWTGPGPDGRPARKDTPFFLASIDKLLNAVLAMKLSEQGRLDLDASISTYLPRGIVHGLHRLNGTDYSGRITVRHLLGHTSGLADCLEDHPARGPSVFERLMREGDMALSVDDAAAIVRERLTPHFPPQDLSSGRQRIRYCDTNYILLAAIIEAVTGQPLHEVHERLLFRPLGMRHTWFPGRSEPLDPTPEGVALRFEGRPVRLPLLLRSLWGIYSTLQDSLRFLRALVRGDVFESPATFQTMQGRWNRFGFPLDRAALRAPGWPIEYGLGLMRFSLPRIFTPACALPAVIGHTGSTGCWLFYCPQWDVYLAGSVDEAAAGALPFRIVPKILRILRHRPQNRPAPRQEPSVPTS